MFARTARSDLSNVFLNGNPNFALNRILLKATTLRTLNCEFSLVPIEIVQEKSLDLATAAVRIVQITSKLVSARMSAGLFVLHPSNRNWTCFQVGP